MRKPGDPTSEQGDEPEWEVRLRLVATKPANNVEPSTAEPVEPRAETKGNVGQQSTCRAQDQESVSQALDCIRQVARQRKKERFTSLHHHIDADLLRMALSALKRDASAGVDGLMWKDYEADLERSLKDLHARVHRGSIPGTAEPATVHTKGGRQTAPSRDRDTSGIMDLVQFALGMMDEDGLNLRPFSKSAIEISVDGAFGLRCIARTMRRWIQ